MGVLGQSTGAGHQLEVVWQQGEAVEVGGEAVEVGGVSTAGGSQAAGSPPAHLGGGHHTGIISCSIQAADSRGALRTGGDARTEEDNPAAAILDNPDEPLDKMLVRWDCN